MENEMLENYIQSFDEKTIALTLHLNNITIEELEKLWQEEASNLLDDAQKLIDDGDYEVYDDVEADEKWDESLDNYIEECIRPQFEKAGISTAYFNDDARKNDARYDWRWHSLARYDWNEDEATVNGTTFYIYRQN